MAKKKHSRSSSSTDHELAIVKAAAWAWYQRGSGSEANPMSEFDVARTHRVVYKPSRYKLEAMKISEQEEEEEEADNDNISLLDSYEIESISKRFDQLINSNTATELLKNVSQNSETTNTRKKAAKKSRGFWLRHAVICGTRQDAVVDARLYGVSRRPEKRAPVVSSIYSSFHDSN